MNNMIVKRTKSDYFLISLCIVGLVIGAFAIHKQICDWTRETTKVYLTGQFKVGSGGWQEKTCEIELEGSGEVQTKNGLVEQRVVYLIGVPEDEATIETPKGILTDCGWRAYAVEWENTVTCVPRIGTIIARTWEELTAVGVDPACRVPWLCDKAMNGDRFWEINERWTSFYAGMYGIDNWLPEDCCWYINDTF